MVRLAKIHGSMRKTARKFGTSYYRESHRAYMRAWREKKKLEKMDNEKVTNK